MRAVSINGQMAFLGAGDTIQVEASAGSSITLSGGVLEEAV